MRFLIKANILIDQDGHARLADFGLLTIVSDPTNCTASSSVAACGTTRWMSPELLDPDRLGFKDSRPTQESDCYALGMVILEVLSGQAPFAQLKDFVVMRKVTEGERPGRPEGAEGTQFTDDLWQMLNQCWETQPGSRPSIQDILECLERVSGTWTPPSPHVDEGAETDESDLDLTMEVIHLVWLLLLNSFTPHSCGGFRVGRVPDPLSELTPPPSTDPPRGSVTVMEALLTILPSYSVGWSGKFAVHDKGVADVVTYDTGPTR